MTEQLEIGDPIKIRVPQLEVGEVLEGKSIDGDVAVVIRGGDFKRTTPQMMTNEGKVYSVEASKWAPIDKGESNEVELVPLDSWDRAKKHVNEELIQKAIKEANKEGYIEDDEAYNKIERSLLEEIEEMFLICPKCKQSALNWDKLIVDNARVTIWVAKSMKPINFVKYYLDTKTDIPLLTDGSDVGVLILDKLSEKFGSSIYDLELGSHGDREILYHSSCPENPPGEVLGPGNSGWYEITNKID